MTHMNALSVGAREGAVRLSVKVKPRSPREAVRGVEGGALVLAITAPPVDGQANEALLDALARLLAVKRRSVTIVSGETARNKIVEITGISAADVGERLGVEVA